jgi:serine/threonine protein kinase
MKHFDKRRFINHPKRLVAVANEIAILRRISHPRVMKIYRVYEDDQAVYLVTELIPGHTLLQSLNAKGTFRLSEAKQFVLNMLDLFTYLTAKGILHRDVKPENIMIPDSAARGEFKLIDFGFATNWTGAEIKDSCGSPGYMAPEIMWEHSHGQSVDIYSAGMVDYVLIVGYSPFYATKRSEVMRLNAENSITFGDKWVGVDCAYIEMIESMTATNPSQRQSVPLLRAAFLGRLPPTEADSTDVPDNKQDDCETQP